MFSMIYCHLWSRPVTTWEVELGIGVSSLTIATAFHEKTFSIGCYPKIIYILNYDKIMDSSIY